jgi:hypothetical protein
MNVANLLRRAINTDKELYLAAKQIGLKELKVIWLSEYKKTMTGPIIINIGNSSNGGTHFVATFDDFYFDSFGQVPPHVNGLDKKQWTELQIQPMGEGHCGAYCLLFLLYATKNRLPQFYSQFKPLNIST